MWLMTKYGFLSMMMDKDRKQEKVFDALDLDEAIPCILMSQEGAKNYRKNWTRLIQKIGACPRLDREGGGPGDKEMKRKPNGIKQDRGRKWLRKKRKK